MAADSGGLNEPLQLEPFIHQVGGHSSMLQLDDETICKPQIPQELNFYKSAPDNLKQFMAEYKGVIEVTFSEAQDGYLDLTTYLPPTYKTSSRPISRQNSKTENEHKAKHKIRLCQSGNIQIDSISVGDKPFDDNIQDKLKNGILNPWVLRCHQQQMKKFPKSTSVVCQKYILLENRTSKYEIPCILDIKMGTRQYGDSATLAKRQSHTAKAAASTSSTLGLRLTGMAVYNHDTGRYIRQNKYYGFSLSVDGFHQVLYNFLLDGQRLRYQVISALLEKLRKLYTVVQSLNSFRFFTSSLLIIYEGKKMYNKNGEDKNITLQLSHNSNMRAQETSNEIHLSSNCDKSSESSISSVCRNQVRDSCTEVDCKCCIPIVDVCMIDFAHATHSQMQDATVTHVGPDEGYLFGLENLIAHLEIILQSEK